TTTTTTIVWPSNGPKDRELAPCLKSLETPALDILTELFSLGILPTPTPGTYSIRDFIQDARLNPVTPTYNFKGEGRKRLSIFQQRQDITLPDSKPYYPPSLMTLLKKTTETYSFKSLPRQSPMFLSYRDKNLNTDPGQYDLFPPPVPTFPIKLFITFQKEGPGPGEYEIKDNPPTAIRSCFISKVPRLLPAHTKIPGPGTYWPTKQSPKQPRTIASLGREHTIFFSNIQDI
uniref:Sperm-tail PG-rich repeat containing 4 n=1 Tax=Anolis carolinensis TaxID=28377 RepID=A0A803SQB8_ANOCA